MGHPYLNLGLDRCGLCGEDYDSDYHNAPLQTMVNETVWNARCAAITSLLPVLSERFTELLALFRDEPWKSNPAAHDAWQLALQHLEPLRAAIARARAAEEGTK